MLPLSCFCFPVFLVRGRRVAEQPLTKVQQELWSVQISTRSAFSPYNDHRRGQILTRSHVIDLCRESPIKRPDIHRIHMISILFLSSGCCLQRMKDKSWGQRGKTDWTITPLKDSLTEDTVNPWNPGLLFPKHYQCLRQDLLTSSCTRG